MGSKEFQMEYIQYLQENNSKLLKKLNEMQENFDNKVCSTDTSKQYFLSTLAETLNICTLLPQEIDSFFEKLSGAINTLKNILIIKSELVQLAEKISQLIKPYNIKSEEISENNNILKNLGKTNSVPLEKKEKGGTVKVSPMIEGHVISTEPKIYLNRISRRQVPEQLSPIVETSPGSFSESPKTGDCCTRELRNSLPSLKISSEKLERDQIKKKFNLRRNWMKNLTEESKSDSNENTPVNDRSIPKGQNKTDSENQGEIDPREGPSWLYQDSFPDSSSVNENFVNKRRRRNLFPTVLPESEISDAGGESAKENAEPMFPENEMSNISNEKKIDDSTPIIFDVSPICKTESLMSLILQQSKSNSDIQTSFQFNNKSLKKELLGSSEKASILKQQPLIILEDCLMSSNFSPDLSKSSTIKVDKLSSKSDFYNSICSSEGTGEGRKRRKAAPTNLAEPTLKTKLRRE